MSNITTPSKLPFYLQETPDSCVPACLRMVLAGFGMEIAEAELRELCDGTFEGTSALQAVDAARAPGFTQTSKHTLTLTELEAVVSQGQTPIVFVEMEPINGIYQVHALVVTNVTPFSVQVLDPASGERIIPRQVFQVAWEARHYLTILIAR
jgi:ABC-type bacteriocin/lantibiotic exporter with double-glycine peptidase domain